MKIIILIGPPGAGKGTLGSALKENFNALHLSTGDVLREIAQQPTELGRKIKEVMNSGNLLDDATINHIMKEYLSKDNLKDKIIILDGYPRTLEQARFLEENFKVNGVIYVLCSEDTIIKRLSSRRVCPKCGAVYNLITKPPKKENICDVCGSKLIQRDDDKPEVIKKRLETYYSKTKPIIKYYESKNLVFKVSSDQSLDKFINEGIEKFKKIIENNSR